jgi:acetoin utilization deacetylase AcuC-like enzyme
VAFYGCDRETPIGPDTHPAILCDVSVVEEAVRQCLLGNTVYCGNVHPGHHAFPERYGGFCYVNSAVIACSLLLDSHAKVAHLDVDYHHGNGSSMMHRKLHDPRVFFASLHIDPALDYPDNSGFKHQSSDLDVNVPLPRGTTGPEYAAALRGVVMAMKDSGVSAAVVSLGTDGLKDDPCASPSAGFALLPSDFFTLGAVVALMAVPTVVVQEGGYLLDESALAVREFMLGLTSVSRCRR